jgi:AhpD family alkylhydroperoxidase
MQQRLDFYKASPDAIKALMALEVAIGKRGLEPRLLELLKLRTSQINGCAFCVDMHVSELRKSGETERRMATFCVWRETPFFTEREQAALAWAEAIAQVPNGHPTDAVYEALSAQFTETEQVDLTLALCAINSWNRLSVGFRKTLST